MPPSVEHQPPQHPREHRTPCCAVCIYAGRVYRGLLLFGTVTADGRRADAPSPVRRGLWASTRAKSERSRRVDAKIEKTYERAHDGWSYGRHVASRNTRASRPRSAGLGPRRGREPSSVLTSCGYCEKLFLEINTLSLSLVIYFHPLWL